LILSIINKKQNLLLIQKEDLLEKINIISQSVYKKIGLFNSLEKKQIRYLNLENIVSNFNQNLLLQNLGETIVDEVFRLFDNSIVLLYLLDRATNKINLSFSRKKNQDIVIKEKHGDIFDEWVIKNNQGLFLEDVFGDFRFDAEKIRDKIYRQISSLMIFPLVTNNRFIGILRVESDSVGYFNSEDFRFLSTLSSLATVALENSLLFEEIEELAIRDGLTGLYSKRYLNERGIEEIKFAKTKKQKLSLLMIDIDNFKLFNDNYGHRCGDIVLVHIANVLIKSLKSLNNLIARFGGEEFVVLLPQTNKEEALSLAEKIRFTVEKEEISLRRKKTKVSVSIGVATFPDDADSWHNLIYKSDIAMYKAKQLGKNRICSA